jgi:galactokinase
MIPLLSKELRARFAQPPAFVVRAPGRVNLIGEHTDYNEGFVLPMAIDRAIWIALRPRADRRVSLASLDFPVPAQFSLDQVTHEEGWQDYVRGMAWALQDTGLNLQGWEGVLASDIPVGAGLSSSAAIELAVARAFWACSRWPWNPVEIARCGQRVENEWLGLKTGIMDQMISASGKQGHALLIDCRDLSTRPVPLPAGTAIIVLDTATRRGLVDSAYNDRVAQCDKASAFFGVTALRDVSLDVFEAGAEGLDPLTHRRARHVITENDRTLRAADAMLAGGAQELGKLMNASHTSMRDDFAISSAELNVMVDLAQAQPGCYGARMTGGGFGGCAVALVQQEVAPEFAERVAAGYQQATGIEPHPYICQATNGAELVQG